MGDKFPAHGGRLLIEIPGSGRRTQRTFAPGRAFRTAAASSHPWRKQIQPRASFIKFSSAAQELIGQFRVFSAWDRASMEDNMKDWTNARYCDVANLILGAFLFVSPWIFGFGGTRAAENANIAGVIIAVLAIAALAAFAVWEEWLNLIVGLWTLISPWVVGFHDTTKAMTVTVVVGILVAVLAAVEIWMTSQIPPRFTTGR
jgi:hypothetical protein